MKPLVVTKWVKNQYYLLNHSDSRNPVWLQKSNIWCKEKIKSFHKVRRKARYNKTNLPPTFLDKNSGWGDLMYPKTLT